MSFLRRVADALFGVVPAPPERRSHEQLVFVTVPASAGVDRALTTESPQIRGLKDRLEAAVSVGRVERVAAFTGNVAIWLYGESADAIWAQASPIMLSSPLTPRGYVLIRHGGPGAFERQIEFDHVSTGGPTSAGAGGAVS